jgi:hypothetical protein
MATCSLLERYGYDGPLFILLDEDDKTRDEYHARYGDKVIVIKTPSAQSNLDSFDNFGKHAVLHGRNVCFDIAESLGYKYFLQLDDDYTGFGFRFPEPELKNVHGGIKWSWVMTRKTLNEVIRATIRLFIKTGASSIAYSQGGDWMSASSGSSASFSFRKCMNSFFCSTSRRFNFIGRANEDVNTYTLLGSRGLLFLTLPHFQVCQRTTQKCKGGTTDVYLDEGTYVKSFYSILCAPSCVKIKIMGSARRRLHHKINWDTAVPMILSEQHKKEKGGAREIVNEWPETSESDLFTRMQYRDVLIKPKVVIKRRIKTAEQLLPKKKSIEITTEFVDHFAGRGFYRSPKADIQPNL